MEYSQFYSASTRDLTPSAIRDVIEMVAGKELVSLGAGWPNPECFPVDTVDELTSASLADRGDEMLQYGQTPGYRPLREGIADRLAGEFGLEVPADDVLVTCGSQQALYLLGEAFLDDGDEVLIGAPTYVAAMSAFDTVADPEYVGVPVDEEGLDVDALEARLQDADPKLLYTVPTFQNPSGTTMPADRRERLVDLAEEHDFLIVEDQPYQELRYEGAHVDPIASHGRGRTVFLSTFSKVLAPGFRVGWLVAPEPVHEKLAMIKEAIDLHTSSFSQHVAHEYLDSGEMDDQIDVINDVYDRKRGVILDALDAEMPPEVGWTRPEGGMFVWMTYPEGVDTREMLVDASDNGVAYVPGFAFYPEEPRHDTLRLNFTLAEDDEIRTGVERLAETTREWV
jgi:2-aminoadipate transaminase